MVKELRWFRSWASKEIGKFPKTSVRMTTTPRVSDGSRSLRRVDKIAGEPVEGLPYKIDGERDGGLSCKAVGERDAGWSWGKFVKNELNDSLTTEETADAGRRTAGTWCGLKEVEWWVAAMAPMAPMATMASMASVASMAPMVPVVAMASMIAVASLNR